MTKHHHPRLLLVGPPNVGKSLLFSALTGSYAIISNYPGTTVDLTSGYCVLGRQKYEVIDMPGIYSLSPLTEEEWVTRRSLFSLQSDVILQVIDAKNLERMLLLTYELIDTGLPIILVVNMIDEANKLGMQIDQERLAAFLKIPVVIISALKRQDIRRLQQVIQHYGKESVPPILFSESIENALFAIGELLPEHPLLSRRICAYLLLQNDRDILSCYDKVESRSQIDSTVRRQQARVARESTEPLSLLLISQRSDAAAKVVRSVIRYDKPASAGGIANYFAKLTRQRLTGIPIGILILYVGLYEGVGKFGAGILVDYLDKGLFQQLIIPNIQQAVFSLTDNRELQLFIVGDYGIVTLGLRYAVAIVLPIVSSFFFVFALLEDCGYLPRLAVLTDRLFVHVGLNGRAVVPVFLGFGCGTLAVVATRTLATRRERLIATFLLALTIPCSAQLGLILALLSHHTFFLLFWALYVTTLFFWSGLLCNCLLPGKRSLFFMELPPLRLPRLTNICQKTWHRINWYFMEAAPVFICLSVLLSLADMTNTLTYFTQAFMPLLSALALPPEAAKAFFMGFVRRDYGTAGLYDLFLAGRLNDLQLLTACITFTLFLPCLAQFAMMIRERGIFVALIMAFSVFVTAMGSGIFVRMLLG